MSWFAGASSHPTDAVPRDYADGSKPCPRCEQDCVFTTDMLKAVCGLLEGGLVLATRWEPVQTRSGQYAMHCVCERAVLRLSATERIEAGVDGYQRCAVLRCGGRGYGHYRLYACDVPAALDFVKQ